MGQHLLALLLFTPPGTGALLSSIHSPESVMGQHLLALLALLFTPPGTDALFGTELLGPGALAGWVSRQVPKKHVGSHFKRARLSFNLWLHGSAS